MYVTGNGNTQVTDWGNRSWRSVPGKEKFTYLLKTRPNNVIAHQHTFILCDEKTIPCGNGGNMPGGDSTRLSPGGDNARVSPLGEIHRCFFPSGNSGNKNKWLFSCVTGNICPKFGVTYVPDNNSGHLRRFTPHPQKITADRNLRMDRRFLSAVIFCG